MNEQEYLKNRVDNQYNYYNSKSTFYKKWFLRLRFTGMLLSLIIPFAVAYITESTPALKIFVGAIGIIVAAISSLIVLAKFQENWIEYRSAAESLEHEKFLFLTQS